MKNFFKDAKKPLLAAFVLFEFAIYFAFIIMQACGNYNTIEIKYVGILLCLGAAAVSIYFYGKDALVVTCALVFTAIADMFILVRARYMEAGLVAFIATQTTYFIRIYLLNGKNPLISLCARLATAAICIIVLAVTDKLSPLVGLVAVYLPMLVANTVESGLLVKISKRHLVFFIGMVLFLGCDICVGLNNAAMVGLDIPHNSLVAINFAIWIFYLPSQVLIALSAHNAEYKSLFKFKSGQNEE